MPHKEPLGPPARQVALLQSRTKATWIALAFASVCLALDVYAMVFLPHHYRGILGDLHPHQGSFPYLVWALEIVLALLALWLIRFAFSSTPRFTPAELATFKTP